MNKFAQFVFLGAPGGRECLHMRVYYMKYESNSTVFTVSQWEKVLLQN